MRDHSNPLNQSRQHLLKSVDQEGTLIQSLIQGHIKQVANLPEGHHNAPALLLELRELLQQLADNIWTSTELVMRMSGEIPEWAMADAMHHPVQDRYAYIRLEGTARDQMILMESFDRAGQATLDRLSIFDFHPAQWNVVPRTLYQSQLATHLEAGTLTWNTSNNPITC